MLLLLPAAMGFESLTLAEEYHLINAPAGLRSQSLNIAFESNSQVASLQSTLVALKKCYYYKLTLGKERQNGNQDQEPRSG